ncbi:cytochrome b/b6 domain-containing protein [Williamsia phyllosphaerae]|uniref:Formate dehydrogenase subunit gamma n=1 Tax=Williamsia phyllosphaerae TaxID=885042 RepID=A0ABQ1UN39_9NOCA|nr:cytochrome b/b6 domain-containing protein [Williamsia phyllosphaerae]GGF23087.1 formate dehydrogenase subunit gamma [Williamsia phyllosphaerae]
MSSTAPSTSDLPRFGRTARAVHWSVTVLMIVCIVTALFLYVSSLAILVGNRHLIEIVHVYAGFALPVPLILGLASPGYRDDLRRLNRFLPTDWKWLRTKTRRDGTIPVGKFNAGQKLNGALQAGSIVVLFGTGVLMYFPSLVGLSYRSGATFAHDWFALGVGILVLGHIAMAMGDPEARRGMRTGSVPEWWAQTEHGAWADEMTAGDSKPDPESSRG